MLEISKYIKDLLFVHDCVILPGFGGFVANYVPARIDENQNLVFPPSKAIGFNRNLIKNDGLLINRVAEAENLSYAEAEKSVLFFIEDIRVKIQRGEKIVLNKIGSFLNDKRHNLQFEPSKELNYLVDTFGLEQLELPQLTRFTKERIQPANISSEKYRTLFTRKRLWYAAAAIPFALAIAFFTGNSERDQFLNSASLGLLDSEKNVITKAQVQLKPQISPPEELVRYEPKISENVGNVHPVTKGKYYLIAGSFTSLKNAEILKQELISKSYPAIIIENKNLFSVAINQFDRRSDVDNFKKKVIAANPKASCWVLEK